MCIIPDPVVVTRGVDCPFDNKIYQLEVSENPGTERLCRNDPSSFVTVSGQSVTMSACINRNSYGKIIVKHFQFTMKRFL